MFEISELKRRLRVLRARFDLTQQDVASLAGMDYKFYQLVESPRKKQIWLETINRIAAVYRMELWQFFHPRFATFAKSPRMG